MARVQQEATAAVSAAIAAAEGDLLSAVDEAQDKWHAELNDAKTTARTLLANVLAERESLRTSLGTAAELWRTLRPRDVPAFGDAEHISQCPDAVDSFLANEEQMAMVKALQNVTHTLFLTDFIMSAPEALESAQASLLKIQDDGLDQVVAGNAALLVEAHSILTAGERLRDLLLLECPGEQLLGLPPSEWFSSISDTRTLLEEVVIHGIFSNLVHISQQNPRLLVAGARVVESEELEDEWWRGHLQRCDNTELAASVRSFGARGYKKQALDAIVHSLQSHFRRKEKELGLRQEAACEGDEVASNNFFASQVEVTDILDWIDHRRSENETVRRFVMPCVPPSFAVSRLYENQLHRQFMQIITRLLHLVHPDGSMLLSEADLIQLTSWYSRYKDEVGDHDEAIDSFLGDADRKRLISALQKHCGARILAKMSSCVAADRRSMVFTARGNVGSMEGASMSRNASSSALRRTDLPDVVLGCVNEQVKRMLALKVRGLDQAIAQTAAECLTAFQGQVRQAISESGDGEDDEEYRLYICTTANNMARCLEHSEDLRDMFVPLTGDHDRSDIEERMERVIEGFRSTAASALHILINEMTSSLQSHATRLFAPHTGTEIMLDIVATMEDYFKDYEAYLLPYHFEHLAIESLRRVVVWYLVPFLRLSNHRLEESAARRFTSLPTFDEINLLSADVQSVECSGEFFSRRSENDRRGRLKHEGLVSLNGAAVVAQIDKDIANVTQFMERRVVLYQKKQLQPTLEPLHAIRSLYTCPSTTFGLSDTYREASVVIRRALRPEWVVECCGGIRFNPRVAEVIWECRRDVNPVVLLEAINMIRTNAERIDSASPGRRSSFDDGRIWESRNSDFGGPFSERLLGKDMNYSEHAGSSSSLLWAPSVSRSWRSRSRRR